MAPKKKKSAKKPIKSRAKKTVRKSIKKASSTGSRKLSKAKTKTKPAVRRNKRLAGNTAGRKKTTPPETVRILRSSLPTRGESRRTKTDELELRGLGSASGGQSGDLQGLSNRESADSESVEELLEEGNAFEAEVVKGVQDAPDADEGEVTTHQREENETDDFSEQ
jgi:hypothetical protein